ncbi:hypothetical protein H6A18_06085 [Collinsella tanakaei]|nr:hypothetical protein [Collinsella tanakaei]MBM6756080.1 hypothetical protein [Collinsella tanakaei]
MMFRWAAGRAVADRYDLLPAQIADRGMVIVADIARVLADARNVAKCAGA